MCGIAGSVGLECERLPEALERIRHRGPDGSGLWQGQLGDARAGLAHARLAVIDLSPAGQQPMATADEQIRIVYNGEIYNSPALRSELEALGHRFQSHSDTEVILLGYRQWGDAVLQKLQGMFAFAIIDAARGRLLLARDRLGIKPLYYEQAGSGVRFASEVKGILALRDEAPPMDLAALRGYLTYLYVPGPKSIFKGILQLPPAHALSWEKGAVRLFRYWELPAVAASRPEREVFAELRPLLEETVRSHLLSDVPLGAFLSGGVDSSTLVALMARNSSQPVKTFCMTFEADAGLYDEREYARLVAQRYATDHTEIPVRPDLAELLPQAVRHFDEPFGNPTALLGSALAAETRRHVKVALAGDGGDEVFLGYPRYQGAALSTTYRRLPAFVRRLLAKQLAARLSESTRGAHTLRRIREFLMGSQLSPEAMYASWVTYCSAAEQQDLLTPDAWQGAGSGNPFSPLGELLQPTGELSLVDRAQRADLQTFLPGNLLTYSDRMSMAHALEVRVPFCDHRLVEFMARIPASDKMPRLRAKALLHAAVDDLLPAKVRSRRKLGFNPPVGIWLNGPLRPMMADLLSERRLKARGLFQPTAVQRWMEEHRTGRRDRTLYLWALLNFEVWADSYLPAA
jgi:asparagine synthase (glutamine-hydrolysing)